MQASGLGWKTEQYWIALACVQSSFVVGILLGKYGNAK
jgi:hypothetical protein